MRKVKSKWTSHLPAMSLKIQKLKTTMSRRKMTKRLKHLTPTAKSTLETQKMPRLATPKRSHCPERNLPQRTQRVITATTTRKKLIEMIEINLGRKK